MVLEAKQVPSSWVVGLDKIKSEGKRGQIGLTLWKYEEMGQAAHLGLKYTTFPVGQESISPARQSVYMGHKS